MTITNKTKVNINTINDLLHESLKEEQRVLEESVKKGITTFEDDTPKWQRLQYVIFQLAIEEIVDKVISLCHLFEMTEDDFIEMTKSAGMDIDTAYDNAMKNMIHSILEKFLGI